MPDSYLVYRALFPPFYSARSDDNTGDVDTDRHFMTLCLPRIRLFGPMWSFGMHVRQVDEVSELPGMREADRGPASRSSRALYEMQDPIRLGKLKRFHTPVFLRAEIDRFLQPIPQELFASRLSLLALDTIDRKNIDGDELKKIVTFDVPVANNAQPIVDGAGWPSICASRSIVVSPFGDPPPPETDTTPPDRGQYLPAMQLMHGAIRFEPDDAYLAKVRTQLGLGVPQPAAGNPPEANERLKTIVLLPDGFCVAGSVQLPWRDPADKVTAWFKATFRHIDRRERVQRVLKLWFDPADRAHEAMRAEWRGHLAQLERLLRGGRGAQARPRWLDFGPNAAPAPEHLFWPETGPAGVPLLSRLGSGSRVSIDSAALALRIADPERAADPTAVMTVQPDAFDIGRNGTQVTITGHAGALKRADAGTVTARYRFDAGTERLSLLAGGDATRPVTLAVPLIETADLVRRATGLPRPAPDEPALDLLWTFSPLPDGWLHWPMPNATEAALARLAPDAAPPGDDDAPSAADGISGTLAFGNLAGQPGFRPGERAWSFSVADAHEATIELSLDTAAASYGHVTRAGVDLAGVALAFDGFATVTPFRQTPQRLLPDHAERALASINLLAVSPASLHGIEADLWHSTGTALNLRFAVDLKNFAIEARNGGPAHIGVGATVAWTTAIGGTRLPHCAAVMRPWVWKAHGALPAVQTLPRALAGAGRNRPSGGRALAPLRLHAAPTDGKLVYEAPVDMTASGMAIAIAGAAYEHPNVGTRWRDEIGMAVTTVPSLTLFAGIPAPARPDGADEDDPPQPGDLELGTDWAGVGAPVLGELRHDIALRDEHNAFARAPGPTPAAPGLPDVTPPPPDPEFSPLPGNGPHAALPPGGKGPSNGWDSVWRFLNRRAVLAALDRRALLNRRKRGYALTGVFGHVDFALAGTGGVTLDTRTTLAGDTLGHVGGVTLDFDDKTATPGRLVLRGLPAGTDLAGVTGRFKRGTETIDVVAGTAAVAYRSGAGFTDQFGLNVDGANDTGALVVKRVSDDGGGRAALLATLKRPLVLDAATTLTFHCTDVPMRDGGADSWLGDFCRGADLAGRANAAGLDTNHLAGFRWSLYRTDDASRPLVVQGFVFEPLELCRMTLRANADIATLQIRGRLRLPLRGPGSRPTQPQPEGVAMLTATCPATGPCTLALAVEAPGVTWPLADPATFPGTAPTLHLPSLPAVGGGVEATLRYRFGAADTVAKVKLVRAADGGLAGTLKATDAAGTGSGLDFSALSIALTGAGAAPAHAVTIQYQLRLGPPGARITGKCVLDLLDGTSKVDDLEYRFSDQAGERLPIAVVAPLVDNASFDARHIALCWKSTTGKACGVLGGLRAVSGAGSLMATLAPAGAGYTTGQLDVRARFELAAAGSEDGFVLALDTIDAGPVYGLAGELEVTNVFTWPQVAASASGAWQTAVFPARPARTFTHTATLRFDGQRLAPSALTGAEDVALMVDVDNTVTCAPGDARSWRAFELVRLLPMLQFKASLDAAALPSGTAGLKDGATAYSPLTAPQAQPLIGYAAARHVLQRGAANAGGLSGALAGQMSAWLKNPPAALAVDLSSHLMLAFGTGLSAADKLRAPLVLTSLPGLAFVTPQAGVDVLPADLDHPLRRALACRGATDRTLYLAAGDGYDAHRFPPLEARLASHAAARLQRTFAARRSGDPDLATQLANEAGGVDRGAHHPVFQAVVFRAETGQPTLLAAADFPAAATAFHLSALFAAETDDAPLAIGFGGSGRIDIADLFGPYHGMQDGFAAPGTTFDADIYRYAIGCFRDWARRNVMPGPGLLPQPPTSEPALFSVRLDTLTRDGGAIATIASLALPAHALSGDGWADAQHWAMRALQRVAPWAGEGMLTMRAAGFGLDAAARTMLVRVDIQDYVRPARSERLPAPPLPAQPQFEARAASADPAEGVPAGYLPVSVAPAAFLSDKPVSGVEPRLAANGVTVSWALDAGSGALLEARPGGAGAEQYEDFWIADRERIAVRPSRHAPTAATAPYELTFALPDNYQAAMPRALAPAAYPVRLVPPPRDGAFAQAYAPARVAASRIAARAGAWTSSRAGLAQMPSAAKLPTARASETPVHVRQPRPALLAHNDRTRPSSHEADRHVAVTARQSCVVHGPRALRPGADLERVGLNRAPRSLWATGLTLSRPVASIVTADWDGAIVIDVDRWLGAAPDDAAWTIRSVALVHGSRRFAGKASVAAIDRTTPSLRLDGFTRAVGATGVPARDDLATLAALADVDLELNLTCAGDGLTRQVRFHLYAGAAHGAGGERSLFFRFEDPEFNDRLGGIARLKRTASTLAPADEFVLAADVSEMRPSQRIDVALALHARLPGAAPKPFDVLDGKLRYGDRFVHLLLERLRTQEPVVPLTRGHDDTVSNTTPDSGNGFFLAALAGVAKPVCHALAIDCGSLRAGDGQAAALLPGDQLRLTMIAYDTAAPDPQKDTALVSLLLDVVAHPNLPANASAFALLHLEAGTPARTGVHLYANAPEPDGIEIVDPRDLIEGVVRRRAVYRWRSFQDLSPGPQHYFALQKINAVGGSWLPDKLGGGWQSLPDA